MERIGFKGKQRAGEKNTKSVYYGDQFEKMEMYDDKYEYERYLELLLRIGDRMFLTMVDIDNDGKQEKAILYNDGVAWTRMLIGGLYSCWMKLTIR